MIPLPPELLRLARVDELLNNVSGSEEVAGMVIGEFLLHVEPQLADISAGFEQADLSRVASAAHRFKGSLAAVSAASSALARAGAIESAARQRDVDSALRELAALVLQVDEITRALRSWREQSLAATAKDAAR
jgi:HPt (histidine-containing phosphotransfer) domain-containing protein